MLDRVRSGFVDVVVVLRFYGGVCKYLVSWLCLRGCKYVDYISFISVRM